MIEKTFETVWAVLASQGFLSNMYMYSFLRNCVILFGCQAQREAEREEDEDAGSEEEEEEEEEEEDDIEAMLAEEFEEEEEEEEEDEETEEDATDRMQNDLAEVYDKDTNNLASVQVSGEKNEGKEECEEEEKEDTFS